MEAFWYIALPLAVPGLIAASVFAFIFGWNEFSIALNLTARDTATGAGRDRAFRLPA